ncbi:polyprenol reductase [Monomorium pharaonis]|uniref:polyprenol reductase n=1 Tax=Monomorium pharaonis TaxID=307658 RepID=UPI00063FC4A4|nr:polyprenol reductase [Monomorium pharaonis]XP_012522877.1 polyprenol reductase [Monomorium pharaonis]XP_012522878.1 polyprenol reductase [Monomorium pharaonis]XP_036139352.1 polyprenol reductase [Monomorium pharaonis]
MDINIIRYIFMFNLMVSLLLVLSIGLFESHLPALIKRSILYGKFGLKTPHLIATKFEVPKRWFRHYYILSAPLMTITLCLILRIYLYNVDVPQIVFTVLNTLLGASRKSLISAEDTILVIVICNIHCWKRLYETCYVNIFSDQKMNILIYIVGLAHYIGLTLSILGESQGFVRGSYGNVLLNKITMVKLVCALICIWSSYMQLKTNFILAKLRKNIHGDIVSLEYKIPSGGLFKYVSSPLQLCEILIYTMLSAILWQASTYHYVTFWVIANQVYCAYITHQWYHKTFKNYPKERKILIPFIL